MSNRSNYSLRISTTAMCNLNCKYCNPIRKVDSTKMMSDKDLLEIIEASVKAGVTKIAWTGGEPTVRPHFTELVKKAKKLGIVNQRLTTNGILFYKMARGLKEAGLDQVDISLDTLDRNEFEEICGMDGLGEVKKSIAIAVELFPLTKVSGVITRANFACLDKYVDYVESFNGRLTARFNEIVPCGEIYEKDTALFEKIWVPLHLILFKFACMGRITPEVNRWDMVKSIYFKINGKKAVYGILPNPSVNFKCDREGCTKIRVSPNGYVSNCTIQLKYLKNFNNKTLEEKIKMMEELVIEKEKRDYTGFQHRQKYYDFWRFAENPKDFDLSSIR